MTADIQHDADKQVFTYIEEGQPSVIEYQMRPGNLMVITHTGVPEALGGRGIASRLARHALDHARAQGYKVRPACPFVDTYMRRHPEYEDLRQAG